MMFSQPRRQFALNPLSVGNTESHRLRRPPNGNAVVADDLAELSGLEECSWVVAAKEFLAPNAAFHPEQSQRLDYVVQIALHYEGTDDSYPRLTDGHEFTENSLLA